jgi:hypothetical protein
MLLLRVPVKTSGKDGRKIKYDPELGFRRDVDEICALLGYYAASSGNSVPTFRDNLSVPFSKNRKSKKDFEFYLFNIHRGRYSVVGVATR